MIQWAWNFTIAIGLVFGLGVSSGVSSAPHGTAIMLGDARSSASILGPIEHLQVAPIRWGPTSDERISFWQSDARVWVFERGLPTVAEMLTGPRYGESDATIFVFDLEGNQLGWKLNFSRDRRGRITVRQAGSNQHQELVILGNGSFYLPRFRHALLLLPDGSFEWAPGTLTRGEFVPNSRFSAPDDGRFRRMSDREAVEFSRLIDVRAQEAEERRIRAQQQRAEADDDGLGWLARGLAVVGVVATGGDVSAVPLTGNPLETLNAANSEISRQNALGEASLEATIAAASQQGSATTASGSPLGSSSVVPVTSGQTSNLAGQPASPPVAAIERRAVRFYFVAGMTPRPTDNRNPRCYSNVVTVMADLPVDDPFKAGQAVIAIKDSYRGDFERACLAAGSGPLNDTFATAEGFDSGWPYPAWHPTDIGVRLQ